MSFSGNVSSMSLDEVFSFLASNGLTGELSVQSGDEVSLNLYFRDGTIFFPFSARRGTYHLGKILRATGVLTRDGLSNYLTDLKQRKQALAEQDEDSEEVKLAKRMQFTEEIHDLFLWGNARFEFRPGPWPVRVEADQAAGRGLEVDTTSLLMDVARREDERRRIRRSIPSSRLMLSTAEGCDAKVAEALQALNIDCESSPFDGSRDLDELLAQWGVPHHDALAAVALLVEEGALLPVSPDETRDRIRDLLQGEDLEPAARLLGHWIELNQRQGERFELGLEQEFITSQAFTSGPEESTSLRLEGARLFTLCRVLISLGNPFTLVLHHRGWEKRVAALPGEIYLRNERRTDAATPPLRDYLVKLGSLTKAQAKELAAKTEAAAAEEAEPFDESAAIAELVEAELLDDAKVQQLIDELAEIAFWGRTEAEIRNRSARGPETASSLTVALTRKTRKALQKGLEAWAGVFELVAGENCIFVPGSKAEANDPAARFFQRFDMAHNVGELRRKAQASKLEFAQFVQRGLERGYLRPPTAAELQEGIRAAQDAGNDVASFRLAMAGVSLGFEQFEETLGAAHLRTAALPLPFPALEGDMDGVGLAAVLQALRSQRRTGTLTVTAQRREEKLYFARGEAFILRIEDAEADEFVAFFLGDDGAESMSELGSGLSERGLTDESDLSEAEVRDLKDQFLDVLFWEGSTFGFFQNDLPDEFFNPTEGVTKIALNTGRFLMDAIQSLTEWEQISEVVGGNPSIFEFKDAAAKLDAIRDRGHPEILTLIDGRLCLNDLVRISGQRRLEVGRVIATLVTEGALEITGTKTTNLAGDIPDPIPDPPGA